MIRRNAQRERSPVDLAAGVLRGSGRVIALTGAGISTPSGIPDFRSEHSGLWTHINPLEVASIWGFHEHPERFYAWFRPLLVRMIAARPNGAHKALARLERAGRLRGVITQNIDSLHHAAGSQCVCELHGQIRSATCLGCHARVPMDGLLQDILAGLPPPRCTACNELLKPDVVLFGEPLPYELLAHSQEEALACDAMVVVGTSLEVMPAADLPLLAKRRGARLILVNRTPTALDDQMDIVIRAEVVKTLEALANQLEA